MGLFDKIKKKNNKNSEMPIYLYTDQELKEYDQFIEDNFGTYDEVFHELVSPDIHLDVVIVPPTKEHPFYKMITMGAGAYRMNIPIEFRESELEYAEYIIYLPENWNIKSGDENDYWPIRNLKDVARLPIQTDSWLSTFHTVQTNSEGLPFADNTKFNATLLVQGLNLNNEKLELRLSSGKKINFYQLIPLYPEELEIKQAAGAGHMLDLFHDYDIFSAIDINRKNYGIDG